MAPYILKMRPYLRQKVWGGDKIGRTFGKDVERGQADGPIGEAWEVADLPDGQSVITNGPLADRNLRDAVSQWGRALIGNSDIMNGDEPAFPLLVKLLDAADDLSVQVHPSERDVQTTHPEADSKDEAWLILDADPDGSILHGVRDDIDADALRQAVRAGRAEETLRRVDVAPGDVIRVVPGTIHAICAGVSLLEIQQPSDTTYRVYDYDRPGLDGEPRDLHLEDALAVANFGEQPPTSQTPQRLEHPSASRDLFISVDSYRIEQLTGDDVAEWRIDDDSPQVIISLGEPVELEIVGDESESVRLDRYETAVIPAAAGDVRASAIDGEYRLIGATAGGVSVFASN
jgi:mannose-6-phosphate isomerase